MRSSGRQNETCCPFQRMSCQIITCSKMRFVGKMTKTEVATEHCTILKELFCYTVLEKHRHCGAQRKTRLNNIINIRVAS